MAKKRIEFTQEELDLITSMISIAWAGNWGAGDYQDWDEKTYKPFNSLQDKVNELKLRKLARKKSNAKQEI